MWCVAVPQVLRVLNLSAAGERLFAAQAYIDAYNYKGISASTVRQSSLR